MHRVLGALGALVLALILAYGTWLLATPDADGGRQPVGILLVGGVGVVALLGIALYAVARPRRRTQGPL